MASSIIVGTLRAILTADTAQYEQGMRKAATETTAGVSKMSTALGSMGKLMAGAFTVTAVVAAGKAVLNFASDLTDLAQKTGISTTGLQKLNLAFEQSGVSLDSVTRASSELGARLATGEKSAVSALQKLGLSVSDLRAMKPEDQFIAVADAVGRIQNKGEQLAVSKTLFGKGGVELLQGLTGNLKETTDEFENMGLIIDEQTVKAADDFGDKLGLLGKQLMGVVASIVGPLLPALSGLASILMQVATVVGKVIGFLVNMAQVIVVGVYAGIMKLLGGLAEAATKIPLVGKHLTALGDAAGWLKDQAAQADGFVDKLIHGTTEVGETASRATPPVLDLGEKIEKTSKAAEKAAEAKKKWLAATNEATAGLTYMLAKLQVMPGALESMNASIYVLASSTINLGDAARTAAIDWNPLNQNISKTIPIAEKTQSAFGSMITGMQSSLRSLMEGMTGGRGLEGFFNNLGKSIVDGFGNILSGGITAAVNLGVSLALKGIAKIAGLLKGLFESEESKHVNKPRDQFFAQYGGLEGLASKLTAVVPANQADSLIRALYAADTVAKFKSAQQAIVDLIGGNVFRHGTPGLGFTDFGLGTLARLDGREAVVPEHRKDEFVQRWGGMGQSDALALLERVERGNAAIIRELRDLPAQFRNALLTRA